MSGQRIEDHYARSGSGSAIVARIIAALRAHSGADVAITPESLAPIDHLHGRGALATEELVALLDPQPGEAILDIGSGLGGPARWIATKFNCTVTGVDLTEEHCDAARELNAACGLSDRVRIMQASALDLPLPDANFDRAYSHNVVMNIADKARVYREAFRVLKPGGRLVLFHVNAGPNAPVEFFPVGWASVPENSFLATHEETRRDLGCHRVRHPDVSRDVGGHRSPQRRGAAQIGNRGPAAARSTCRSARRRPPNADQQHARPRRWSRVRGADRRQKTRSRRSRPMIQRRHLLQAGAAAAALPRFALAQNKPDKLVFVGDNGPWHWCLVEEVAPAFEKATGIKVDFTLLPIDALSARLKAELNSGSVGIDIIQWTATIAGWLAQHMEDHEKLLASTAAKHPDFDWDDFLPADPRHGELQGQAAWHPISCDREHPELPEAVAGRCRIPQCARNWAEFQAACIATTKRAHRNATGLASGGARDRRWSADSRHSCAAMAANISTRRPGRSLSTTTKPLRRLQYYGDLMTQV